ncbi:POL1 protein, partial [Cnemophilus loriae]|nr:POL1 protein [Cnemophilus loriae]
PSLEPRVLNTPQEGITIFTDASSRTHQAVIVWLENEQQKHEVYVDEHVSVQVLEAKGVELALRRFPDQHTNIVTDSCFVYRLIHRLSKGAWATSDIARQLDEALQVRVATVTVLHVNSHTQGEGPFVKGNALADRLAGMKTVATLEDARNLHQFLHLGAKALAKATGISLSDARTVVSTCPWCQS